MQVHATEDGDIIIHKDIREGKKRGGHLTLGTPLKITISHSLKKEETFEDLDEIMARYVEPLLEKYQEVINHRSAQFLPHLELLQNLSGTRNSFGAVPVFSVNQGAADGQGRRQRIMRHELLPTASHISWTGLQAEQPCGPAQYSEH